MPSEHDLVRDPKFRNDVAEITRIWWKALFTGGFRKRAAQNIVMDAFVRGAMVKYPDIRRAPVREILDEEVESYPKVQGTIEHDDGTAVVLIMTTLPEIGRMLVHNKHDEDRRKRVAMIIRDMLERIGADDKALKEAYDTVLGEGNDPD